jgi:hypothetical protein
MRTLGFTLRNTALFALCVVVAGLAVIPALYLMLANGTADAAGRTLPLVTSHPYLEALGTLTVCLLGIGLIVLCGLLVRFTSLWTVAALLMALPMLHGLSLSAHHLLPDRFKAAWTFFAFMPVWGWWAAVATAFVLFVVSWPFGHAAVPVQEEAEQPQPAPKRGVATGS